MSNPLALVTERAMMKCGRVDKTGHWYRCAHPCSPQGDTGKSFAFTEMADGTVVVKSHKPSYSSSDCLAALGLEWRDLFPSDDKRTHGTFKGDRITHGYEYTAENGRPVGRVERTEGKQFPQGIYVDGQFKYGAPKGIMPLYLLPYVKQWVSEGRTIYITEGEKDARNMIRAGYAATSKPGGSSSAWEPHHIESLAGAEVVVVADKDSPGYNAAKIAGQVLPKFCKSVRIVESAFGKDATDHLDNGGTADTFVDRSDLLPRPRIVNMKGVPPEEPLHLWADWQYLRLQQINLLDAKGGTGKSSLSMFFACCGSNGVSPAGVRCDPFGTLYYGNEDSCGELRAVVDQMGGDPSRIHIVETPFPLDSTGFEILEDDLARTGARLLVLDAVKYYLPGKENAEFDSGLVARFQAELRGVARRMNCAPLEIRHFSRNQDNVDLMDRGAGLEQWRNSCRSQLVMLPIPGKPGNAMVWHTKGSIRAVAQEPFACGWSGGTYGIYTPDWTDFERVGIDREGFVIKKKRERADPEPPRWFD